MIGGQGDAENVDFTGVALKLRTQASLAGARAVVFSSSPCARQRFCGPWAPGVNLQVLIATGPAQEQELGSLRKSARAIARRQNATHSLEKSYAVTSQVLALHMFRSAFEASRGGFRRQFRHG